MAHILPDTPPSHLPSAVNKVFKSLKRLPDTVYIWHHLAPWQKEHPDFLLISNKRQVVIIKVSLASVKEANLSLQFRLLEQQPEPLAQQEFSILDNFCASFPFQTNNAIHRIVVFPNIDQNSLAEFTRENEPSYAKWASNQVLLDGHTNEWLDLLPDFPMEKDQLILIRKQFCPEIVVPAELTTRQPTTQQVEAGLRDFLLDYDQEIALKNDLELPEDQSLVSKDIRVNIINGVAGSGKTLILLYRLRLLSSIYPSKRFLVVTHNKPLLHDLHNRYIRITGSDPSNITWSTFYGLCRKEWPLNNSFPKVLSLNQKEELLKQVWENILANTAISLTMLQSEIEWIKDQPIETLEEYLQADRRGRKFRTNQDQRNSLWSAYLEYQASLKKKNVVDWNDIPVALWTHLHADENTSQPFDAIFIDEAQFFAPLWFRLIQKFVAHTNPYLFMVADPTQGFLRNGTSWKSIGLDVRGKTYRLKRSYRTTSEILQFALSFYRSRQQIAADDDILLPDLFHMPKGVIPQIIPLRSPQDEIARAANEVEDLVKLGMRRNDLLILHVNGEGVSTLIQAIEKRLGKGSAMDPKDTYPGNYVRVTTLNAGTGLESPIVFILGLHELFESEQSLRLSDEDRDELVNQNTRKIYMAATRAGQRLILTYVGNLPQVLLDTLSTLAPPQ